MSSYVCRKKIKIYIFIILLKTLGFPFIQIMNIAILCLINKKKDFILNENILRCILPIFIIVVPLWNTFSKERNIHYTYQIEMNNSGDPRQIRSRMKKLLQQLHYLNVLLTSSTSGKTWKKLTEFYFETLKKISEWKEKYSYLG